MTQNQYKRLVFSPKIVDLDSEKPLSKVFLFLNVFYVFLAFVIPLVGIPILCLASAFNRRVKTIISILAAFVYVLTVVFVITIVIFITLQRSENINSEQNQIQRLEPYPLEIRIPSDWNLKKGDGKTIYRIVETESDVTIVIVQHNQEDRFPANPQEYEDYFRNIMKSDYTITDQLTYTDGYFVELEDSEYHAFIVVRFVNDKTYVCESETSYSGYQRYKLEDICKSMQVVDAK